MATQLDYFFNPKSVAVIGASRHKGKVGHEILANFAQGFRGKIFPINPNADVILSLKTYKSVAEIPEKIDLAVIAIPADIVAGALKDCVKKKIPAVIIISGGFAEIGAEGKKREEQLKKIIKGTNTRVLGPNCVGIFDSSTQVDTIFLSRTRLPRPGKGNISFITQSGAVGSTILDWFGEEGLGVSKFISYGNAVDLDESDFFDYLKKDHETKAVTVYMEGIKDGKKFLNRATSISKVKPVVILKAGKTKRGSEAVVSHTGALAGSGDIYSGAFKQTGLIEANSWEELVDFAKGFAMQPLLKGNRLAIITDGGGFGVLATDAAEKFGFELPKPAQKSKQRLRKMLPQQVSLENPIDLTGDATAERYKVAIEECLRSNQFDAILAITLFQVPLLDAKVDDFLIELSKKYGRTIVACAVGSKFTHKLAKKLEQNNIPVFQTPERAIASLAAMLRYKKFIES